jgi:hypothetical protein
MASIINTDLKIQLDVDLASQAIETSPQGHVVPFLNTRQEFSPVPLGTDELNFFFDEEEEGDLSFDVEFGSLQSDDGFELIVPEPHLLKDPDESETTKRVREILGLVDEAINERDQAFIERDEAIEARQCAARTQREALVQIELLNLQHEMILEHNKKLVSHQEEFQETIQQARADIKDRTDQRNEAVKKLARTIHERDTLTGRLDKAIRQREEARCLIHTAEAGRDAAFTSLKKLQSDHALATDQNQTLRCLIEDWKGWREDAQRTLDASDDLATNAHQLAQELLDTPWWSLRRRRAISMQIRSL